MAGNAPVLLIHAGEGQATDEMHDREHEFRQALLGSLAAGRRVLEAGREALDAVQQAVAEMESCELFNAGRGSALCSDGSVRMSAALMRGDDRAAGAVIGVTRTEHPILAARFVLDSDHVVLEGEWADRRAASLGAVQRDNAFFVTERQVVRLRGRDRERAGGAATGATGTVGAVCLDSHRVLAAATSTGGRSGQPPGRVGDSPVIGAGTWADGHVAVSCTGVGEAFIRAAVAHRIAMLVEVGRCLDEATGQALGEVAALGGHGGLIAIDSAGAAAAPLTSEVMPGGVWRSGAEPEVWVTGSPLGGGPQ